jgi:hypothetical protein
VIRIPAGTGNVRFNKKLRGSAENPATALELFATMLALALALWEIVTEVDVHHARVSGRQSAGSDGPRRARNISSLCDYLQVAVFRVPPQSLNKTELRLEEVSVGAIG